MFWYLINQCDQWALSMITEQRVGSYIFCLLKGRFWKGGVVCKLGVCTSLPVGQYTCLFQITFIGDSNADIFSAVTQTVFGGVITKSLYNQQSNLNSLIPIRNDRS